jgi:hypothetical protein
MTLILQTRSLTNSWNCGRKNKLLISDTKKAIAQAEGAVRQDQPLLAWPADYE